MAESPFSLAYYWETSRHKYIHLHENVKHKRGKKERTVSYLPIQVYILVSPASRQEMQQVQKLED